MQNKWLLDFQKSGSGLKGGKMIQEFYLPLIFPCLSFADLKLADIGSNNENSVSPDGTACNLRIQKQDQFLISSPSR